MSVSLTETTPVQL